MVIFVVLHLVWMCAFFVFMFACKIFFLNAEVREAWFMIYIYRMNETAGRILHVFLYAANTAAAWLITYGLWLFFFVDPQGWVYRSLGRLGFNKIDPVAAGFFAAAICLGIRYFRHPVASRLTLTGKIRGEK